MDNIEHGTSISFSYCVYCLLISTNTCHMVFSLIPHKIISRPYNKVMKLLIFIMVKTNVLHIIVQLHAIVMVEQRNEDNYYIINKYYVHVVMPKSTS